MKKAAVCLLKYAFFLLLFNTGCNQNPDALNKCVKGKLITNYCGDAVIQILDDSKIGRDFQVYNSDYYKNCVLAATDSIAILRNGFAVPSDSVIYFQYIRGTFANKSYKNCQPYPFVLLTSVSNNPCSQQQEL